VISDNYTDTFTSFTAVELNKTAMAEEDEAVPSALPAPSVQGGFKQRKNRGNIRKRPTEDDGDAAAEETA